MAEVTVLRVEVAQVDSKNENSLSSNKTTTSSLAAGKNVDKSKIGTTEDNQQQKDRLSNSVDNGSMFLGRGESREERAARRKSARDMFFKSQRGSAERSQAASMYRRNISAPSYKQITGGVSTIATTGASVYSIYSNHQKTGLELSGATHAAALQSRKVDVANFAVSVGVAAMINPLLAAPMLAMKAYQLSQQNRRELFEIRKSQIQSQILQRNLVKNVAERRF